MNNTNLFLLCHLMVMVLLLWGGPAGLCAQPADSAVASGTKSNPDLDYQYFDLNCNVDAWGGYFSPERWVRTVGEAGGVAPLTESVSAKLSPLVIVGQNTAALETWSIEIPVPGYLSFRLMPAEQAHREALRVTINDRTVSFRLRADGLYYSPYLRTGDRFTLHVPASETAYHWTDLLFHTNYSAVIVRPGETKPSRRYEPIEADLIQRVIFPDELPGTWPVFDRDGDPLTTADQTELRDSNERFSIEYLDEVEESGQRFFLQRTFTIREKCSRGNWLRSRRCWVELPIIAE